MKIDTYNALRKIAAEDYIAQALSDHRRAADNAENRSWRAAPYARYTQPMPAVMPPMAAAQQPPAPTYRPVRPSAAATSTPAPVQYPQQPQVIKEEPGFLSKAAPWVVGATLGWIGNNWYNGGGDKKPVDSDTASQSDGVKQPSKQTSVSGKSGEGAPGSLRNVSPISGFMKQGAKWLLQRTWDKHKKYFNPLNWLS